MVPADAFSLQMSSISFPPCMRVLYQRLCDDHHLRNGGRLQLGLFLKAIGMPLDESLQFWKSHFAPRFDSSAFEKNYAYNVRHIYGKEGKHVAYSPCSCFKIITTNPPGPLDAHGCPFKHYDIDGLQHLLSSWSIGSEDVDRALSFVRTKHYDRACSSVFEATHQLPESSLSQLISHPNQYFDQSQKLFKSRAEGAHDPAATSQTDVLL
ncbi:unnamed protein product [Soboliphyme baturini]|uniref:DNA primase large subunit n=1 Tax=Soboliphyme baturini TaxID=241478 RepID=A0A183J968_9BILA|nr:unnamed protein product [Soboliphyme baturini]